MNEILTKRRAGILLHITSLPSADLGKDAYYFVDFLHDCGITVWQTLPLGMTHADGSPYQSLSAHAGNTSLIDINQLVESNWLQADDLCDACRGSVAFNKFCLLAKAYSGFLQRADAKDQKEFKQFCKDKAYWLDNFALFMALRYQFCQMPWSQWPKPLRDREKKAIKEASLKLKHQIAGYKFEQFIFYKQWMAIKHYANQRGVYLFGDIPIFVSYDSADVWANPKVFKLDEEGQMPVVAGVPPDYFSETGQRWGNPHYNWEYLQQTGFAWWLDRMRSQSEQFDILRIDHFRGLEAAWEIPSDQETAQVGQWVVAPGYELLQAIKAEVGSVALVAEDLGIITPEVEALRDGFDLPGMKILQFAFGGGPDNPYLPDNYGKNCVAYTGTHDNDTTLGWASKLSDHEKHYVYEYLGNPAMPLHQALVQSALASVANLAVIPMQDILELGSEHRMNTPGTTVGNWGWCFHWEQLTPERAGRLSYWVGLFNRK